MCKMNKCSTTYNVSKYVDLSEYQQLVNKYLNRQDIKIDVCVRESTQTMYAAHRYNKETKVYEADHIIIGMWFLIKHMKHIKEYLAHECAHILLKHGARVHTHKYINSHQAEHEADELGALLIGEPVRLASAIKNGIPNTKESKSHPSSDARIEHILSLYME